METLKFELRLKERPVVLVEEDGTEKNYKIRELDGLRKEQYLEGMSNRMEIVDGKVSSIKSFGGLETSLLCLCLYDAQNTLVPKEKIQSFPAAVLSVLYEAAQEISGLDREEANAEAKKD